MVKPSAVSVVICACLAPPARAEPAGHVEEPPRVQLPASQTWIGANQYVGVLFAGDAWTALGAGLSVHHRIRSVTIGFEGEILHLDHDETRAFAGQLALGAGYEFRVGRGRGNHYFLVPQLGVTTGVVYGAGVDHRTSNDAFVGARFIMRAWPDDAVRGPATARGISAHADLRVATNAVLVLFGYDWGL